MMLAQLAAAATDTVLVRQVPPVRSAFEQMVFIAQGLTSLLVLALVVLLIAAVWLLKRRVDALGRRLEALVGAVHTKVDEVGETIDGLRESTARVTDFASTAIDGIRLGARAMGLGKKKRRGKVAVERPRVRRRD